MKEILQKLADRQPLQALSPAEVWDSLLDQQIQAFSLEQLMENEQNRKPYALAFKSGLHLWNDNLDKSHTISQNVENETGSYWHGIMHRMEPDYSNANYWFRRVGVHPAFAKLQHKAAHFLHNEVQLSNIGNGEIRSALEAISRQSEWNPYLFIDAVDMQETGENNADTKPILQKLQWLEIAILLQFTYKQSCGGSILESI